MAESIGTKIRNVLVGLLIGLLVIGFAIWGVSDVFTPQMAKPITRRPIRRPTRTLRIFVPIDSAITIP